MKNKVTNSVYVMVFCEQIAAVLKGIKESIGKISVVLQILIPVILSVYCTGISQKIVAATVIVYVTCYLKILDCRINRKRKDGFPLPPCQLTETDKDGFVEIKEGCLEAAIIYLSDVEDYIKKIERYHRND